jgi:hypothetical protein
MSLLLGRQFGTQIGVEPFGVMQKLPVPPPVGRPVGRPGTLDPPPPALPSLTLQTFHVLFCFCTSKTTLRVLFSASTIVLATVAVSPF